MFYRQSKANIESQNVSSQGTTSMGTPQGCPVNDGGGSAANCTSEAPSAAVLELRGAMAELQAKLHTKEADIVQLERERANADAELEELTASLFEEAHKMVREANEARAAAERALKEADMKVDGLETEVTALKALVLTSTPSQPNRHLHPQLNETDGGGISPRSPKKGGARRSLLGGRPNSSGGTGKHGSSESVASVSGSSSLNGHYYMTLTDSCHSSPNASLGGPEDHHQGEQGAGSLVNGGGATCGMDPSLRRDFLAWRRSPSLNASVSPFVARLLAEDVMPCLNFPNEALSARVRAAAVHASNAVCLTPVRDLGAVPRECALMQQPVLCRYLLRLLDEDVQDKDKTSSATVENSGLNEEKDGEETDQEPDDQNKKEEKEEVFHICQLSRNRLAAACDLLGYLRYVERGLVKAGSNEVYWEVQRLRREMALAKLGFGTSK